MKLPRALAGEKLSHGTLTVLSLEFQVGGLRWNKSNLSGVLNYYTGFPKVGDLNIYWTTTVN